MTRMQLRWIVFTTLGLGLGVAVGIPLAAPVDALLGMALVLPVVGAVIGASLGASQWLVLRQVGAARWISATAADVGVGLTAGTVLVESVGLDRGRAVEEGVAFALVGASVGLLIGVGQWLVLRQHRPRGAAWIPRCGVGLALGVATGGLAAQLALGGIGSVAGFLVLVVTAGVVLAVVTGPHLAESARTAAG